VAEGGQVAELKEEVVKDQDAGAHEMDELGSAKRANQDKGGGGGLR